VVGEAKLVINVALATLTKGWRLGLVVTLLGTSTKLRYIKPG